MKINRTKYRPFYSLILLLFVASTCTDHRSSLYQRYLTNDIPVGAPKTYIPIEPLSGSITHQGIFSPDYETYYFTVSDPTFTKFTVKEITKQGNEWSKPKNTFFNSDFNEHGLSFSQDGNTLFFSSTRPLPDADTASTWHLWQTQRVGGHWGEPVHIDIPNLQGQLISHPSIAKDGTLYFHASNPDYTQMGIYRSEPAPDGQYLPAAKLRVPGLSEVETCTPYVDPEEKFILFAIIGEELELVVSKRLESGDWGSMQKLPVSINSQGQGNPQISPDGEYLFFAVGDFIKGEGVIKWVELRTVFQRLNL